MPLPDHAINLSGGCNCGAIRYRINIPEYAQRPPHPDSTGEIRFPLVAMDHCNNCRKATGAIIPTWMCVPANMLSISFHPAPSAGSKITNHDHETYYPSMTALRENSPESANSTLRFYESSLRRTRTFCGHCGTNLTYAIFPMVEGYPDIFDVVLGTIDRGDLEKDWMRPERQLWWDCGIKWVQELASGGIEIPCHPKSKPSEAVH